ncbi:MAG TPA: dihydroneopterin aldolase family protein [Thermoplasmata archaeon]|nr:dihydroneopterin aldolase family protein [Thermoplasmata archaeon]
MTRATTSRAPRLSGREALLFEAGIKLGGVFHQYLGIPVSRRTAGSLARAIESAVGLQPFVRRVSVRIDPSRGGRTGRGRFAYHYLIPEMLEVTVVLVDELGTTVEANLRHRPELRYPLMKVVRVEGPVRPSLSWTRRRRAVRAPPPRRRRRLSSG